MRIFILVALGLLVAAFWSLGVTGKRITQANGCGSQTLTEVFDTEAKVATYEGKEIPVPKYAFEPEPEAVLGEASEERWIEVDLSEQKLRAWEGSSLFLETPVSTGLPWWPTPTGEFRIWIKIRSTKMEGGSGRYYYNLPNVPYVMYFENGSIPSWRGYGLHGTYWHNDFGNRHSHGCVNLPTPIAKQLFYWVQARTEGKEGTKIVIHD